MSEKENSFSSIVTSKEDHTFFPKAPNMHNDEDDDIERASSASSTSSDLFSKLNHNPQNNNKLSKRNHSSSPVSRNPKSNLNNINTNNTNSSGKSSASEISTSDKDESNFPADERKLNQHQKNKNKNIDLTHLLSQRLKPAKSDEDDCNCSLHPEAPLHKLSDLIRNGGKNNIENNFHPKAPRSLLSDRLADLYPNIFKRPNSAPISSSPSSSVILTASDSPSESDSPKNIDTQQQLFENEETSWVQKIGIGKEDQPNQKKKKNNNAFLKNNVINTTMSSQPPRNENKNNNKNEDDLTIINVKINTGRQDTDIESVVEAPKNIHRKPQPKKRRPSKIDE